MQKQVGSFGRDALRRDALQYVSTMIMAICIFVIAGCATTSVSRLETEETVDLSARWNDTDSQLTAKAMVQDALSGAWISRFRERKGKEPMVIVGTVINKSHDHVPTETFTKDLERELTNSGQVFFVASGGEREELREERVQQQTHSSEETAKGLGREVAADYMLKGVINSFEEQADGKTYKYFQVTLELIDIEKNVKVWLGDKKIKKLMKQSKLGF